jgi:hypothetical protein
LDSIEIPKNKEDWSVILGVGERKKKKKVTWNKLSIIYCRHTPHHKKRTGWRFWWLGEMTYLANERCHTRHQKSMGASHMLVHEEHSSTIFKIFKLIINIKKISSINQFRINNNKKKPLWKDVKTLLHMLFFSYLKGKNIFNCLLKNKKI